MSMSVPPSIFREKKNIYGLIIAFVILVILGIWWWRFYVFPYVRTEDANIDGVEISVSSTHGGKIIELLVDEGDKVKKGDLLFRVDDTLLKEEKKKAEAALRNAQDQLVLQNLRVEMAQSDLQRSAEEFQAGVLSTEAMEHVQKAWEITRAEAQSLSSLVTLQQASLQQITTQLNEAQVKASSDGVIARRWHFAGDVIQQGQTVLSLFDLSQVWVSANLEETKIRTLRLQDPVIIKVDAYPDLRLEGKVVMIGAGAASQFSLIPANNASGNFTKVTQRIPLRISIKSSPENERLYLRPGMSVEIKIKTR
ncbi:MAG: HlyD family secretion protein [Verrucomicrobia bacterium]|nr:HlyD family secretion protein [Verrucomicrobiota bacterium]